MLIPPIDLAVPSKITAECPGLSLTHRTPLLDQYMHSRVLLSQTPLLLKYQPSTHTHIQARWKHRTIASHHTHTHTHTNTHAPTHQHHPLSKKSRVGASWTVATPSDRLPSTLRVPGEEEVRTAVDTTL